MGKSSTRETNIDRLPLHRGPFYFAPQFLRSGKDWSETFTGLVTKALDHAGCKAEILSPGDGWQIQARLNTVIFTIDAEGGLFGIEEPHEDWSRLDLLRLTEIPSLFSSRLEGECVAEHLAEDVRSVKSIAEWLHRAMTLRFEQAVKIGDAHFEARLATEVADFTKVARDQLALFDIDERARESFFEVDEEFDSATGRASGVKLFSLCVAPSARHAMAAEGRHAMAADASSQTQGKLGRAGRPETVAHDVLEEIGLELIRVKGVPDPKRANWTGEIFATAVIDKMAERGLTVSRATVLNKKSLIIQRFKKEQPHRRLQKSSNPKIYQN
jgi:hypothetical protein